MLVKYQHLQIQIEYEVKNMDYIDLKELLKSSENTGVRKVSQKGVLKLYKDGITSTSTGREYLKCKMEDTNGTTYYGSVWDVSDKGLIGSIVESGTYVECDLECNKASGTAYWNIRGIKIIEDTKDIVKDFKGTGLDTLTVVECINTLKGYINSIKDSTIQKFLYYSLGRLGFSDDMDFTKNDLISNVGAKSHHHNYKWGLLEHMISTTNKALKYSEVYKGINRDLIIVGALLHDYGKFYTYTNNNGNIGYTLEGSILDHLILGVGELQKVVCELKSIDTDIDTQKLDNLLFYLQGISASHHGHEDFGALKRPFCLEAFIVSQADMGDFIEFAYNKVCSESGTDVVNIGKDKYIHKDTLNKLFS